jgi:hypothetical protein
MIVVTAADADAGAARQAVRRIHGVSGAMTPEPPWIWPAKRGVLLGAVLLGGQGELLG